MIGYLKGQVYSKEQESLVVLAGGVGYQVSVPFFVAEKLNLSDECELQIYTHVREDQLSLYGFLTPGDKKIFSSLMSVSGIGPKLALGIISQSGGAAKIISAVQAADVGFFTNIKGLGKKGAQRLIVDLKTKLGGLKELDFEPEFDRELVEALEGLGFSKKEIAGSVKGVDKDLSLEEKIKFALKKSGDKDAK